jgi:hypothetical protein
MKTAQEWIQHYDNAVPDHTYAPEGFVVKFFEQIQTDARADLLARVKELEGEVAKLSQETEAIMASRNMWEEKFNTLKSTLHQRDVALVAAREALLTVRNKVLFKEGADAVEHALSQIDATTKST